MRERALVMWEYNGTVGETGGNIIAAIITIQMPRNQPSVPRPVQEPSSMPRIWSTDHHHPIPATTKSKATSPSRARAAANAGARPPRWGMRSCAEAIKRSGGPGELGRRESRLALVLDAEGVDAGACRLGDRQVRSDRVEHP